MAGFNDLPTETVLELLQWILPDDLDNFSRVSKVIHCLSKPLLEEHYELRKAYRQFDTRQGTKSIAELLHEILDRPRLAHYIKILTIEELKHGWDEEESGKHRPFSSRRLQPLAKAFLKFKNPKIYNRHLFKRLTEGDERVLITLLIWKIVDLQELNILNVSRPGSMSLGR